MVERLVAALEPDEVVLGGGDVKKLKKLPKGCRAGDNANAFLGGFRLWENTTPVASSTRARSTARSRGQQSTRLGQQGQTRKTEWHNDSQSEYDRISLDRLESGGLDTELGIELCEILRKGPARISAATFICPSESFLGFWVLSRDARFIPGVVRESVRNGGAA